MECDKILRDILAVIVPRLARREVSTEAMTNDCKPKNQLPVLMVSVDRGSEATIAITIDRSSTRFHDRTAIPDWRCDSTRESMNGELNQ